MAERDRDTTPPLRFKVHGLDCAEEVAVLKREVGPVVGGADRLGFDILNGRMTVAAGAGVTAARRACRRSSSCRVEVGWLCR